MLFVWSSKENVLLILHFYKKCMIFFFPTVLGQLLPLLHGNLNSSKVIISEFQEFCRQQTSPSSSSPPELSSPQSPAENIPTRYSTNNMKMKRICTHIKKIIQLILVVVHENISKDKFFLVKHFVPFLAIYIIHLNNSLRESSLESQLGFCIKIFFPSLPLHQNTAEATHQEQCRLWEALHLQTLLLVCAHRSPVPFWPGGSPSAVPVDLPHRRSARRHSRRTAGRHRLSGKLSHYSSVLLHHAFIL